MMGSVCSQDCIFYNLRGSRNKSRDGEGGAGCKVRKKNIHAAQEGMVGGKSAQTSEYQTIKFLVLTLIEFS